MPCKKEQGLFSPLTGAETLYMSNQDPNPVAFNFPIAFTGCLK